MEASSSTHRDVKYDWYQTDSKVVITIMLKNIVEENFSKELEPECVTIRIKLPPSGEYVLNLNLSHEINPTKCVHKLLPSKVELHLTKNQTTRWESLEKKKENTKETKISNKNWDALANQLSDDKEAESSVETLFSKIYSDGTDDQKKAMIKSFYESGGTVLSTNWNEVGKSPVEVKPPEGVEYKPWK